MGLSSKRLTTQSDSSFSCLFYDSSKRILVTGASGCIGHHRSLNSGNRSRAVFAGIGTPVTVIPVCPGITVR